MTSIRRFSYKYVRFLVAECVYLRAAPTDEQTITDWKKKHCGTIFIKISIKQKEKSVRLCLREKALKKTCWKQPNISMSFGKSTYWTAPPRGQS